jgi:uncharacterized protein involved in exopolysaccharide biosynthesis
MNVSLLITRFLYRIRYQVIFGSLIVTLIVGYFMQFLPKKYTVETMIYTGIVASKTSIEGERSSYQSVSNTFSNLITLVKSKNTLEKVALKLLAINLINGNPEKDNTYITSKNYIELLKYIPEDIKKLVDKESINRTYNNLLKYKNYSPKNFLFKLLNGNNQHYSYNALNSAKIARVGDSDMIKLSYTTNDPGIATTTIKLLSEELKRSYDNLRFRSTNDVIAYFEEQVKKYRAILNTQEDELTEYKVSNNVINYAKQTEATAIHFAEYEDRYEEVNRRYSGSLELLKMLEKQMSTRVKMLKTNKNFLETLANISDLNGELTEMEVFTNENKRKNDQAYINNQLKLKQAQRKIKEISSEMDIYKYSKEGVAIDDMVTNWLNALIENTKAKAELKILEERKKDFREKYVSFSPVGTGISRRERDISVTEQTYLQMIRSLNNAYLHKKNIQVTTATLDTITEPSFPLNPNSTKAMLYTIMAMLTSAIFIVGINLLIEMTDRTLRDGIRANRLTGLPVIAAFTGRGQLRYRGFIKTCNRICAAYTCNRLNQYLNTEGTTYINLLSINPKEGKTFVAKYLIAEWEKRNFTVKHIVVGEDLLSDASYLKTTSYDKLLDHNHEDIILVEHFALQNYAVPHQLLGQAHLNLLIANAKRVWKGSDDELTHSLHEGTKEQPIFLYLNNTTREAAEDFTGELPPKLSHTGLSRKFKHGGITASKESIK